MKIASFFKDDRISPLISRPNSNWCDGLNRGIAAEL